MDITPVYANNKKHATMFSMRTDYTENLETDQAENVINKIASEYPEEYKLIQHGDIFENTSDRCIGYRTNGRHMFVVKYNKVSIIQLSRYPDDYGSIPDIFKGIEEFTLDYWNDIKEISLDGTSGGSYWHSYYPDIAISDELKKLIKPIDDNTHQLIKKSCKDFKISDNTFTLEYKNYLYVLSHNDGYDYLKDDRPYYMNFDDIIIIDYI